MAWIKKSAARRISPKIPGASAKPGSAPKKAVPFLGKSFLPPTEPEEPPPEEQLTSAMTSTMARDRLVNAVKHGHEAWRQQAHFRNISVQSLTAIGAPGCLTGPDLEPLIESHPDVQDVSGLEDEILQAVSRGVADCYAAWQDNLMVPGLPWYPAFAAWPGPEAAPTPNVPFSLIACPSTEVSKLSILSLKEAMLNELRDALKTAAMKDLIGQVAFRVSMHFTIWITTQQIQNVLGKGPVPSFAPPYVPAGPVVSGSILETPGHLVS